ncbi:MAG: hypothetical protein KBB70_00825 [Candidatus Pacebacteria bacterium]|jgi:primosomal protein N'|nr:hypothetical protein [Candidatus Paceibacterota bacterium]
MATQMKAVHIFPIGAGPDKGSLSYFTAKDIAEGDTVQISIRGRKVLGIVEKVEDVGEDRSSIRKSPFQLKKIDHVFGPTIHGGALFKTAKMLSRYYLSHPGLVLSAITPAIFSDPALKDLKPTVAKVSPFETPTLIQTSKIDRVIYFKKLIREYFAKKESVAIILPTVQEAKEWRDLLSKGIAEHTILFTGDENKKNQRDMVKKAAESAHPLLLVGTFFAAVLPVQKLGAVIVEHESSNLYETRRRPIIDKRIAAEVFAHVSGVPCYFSDSLLELKTSGRIRLDTAHSVEKLSFRIPGKSPDVIDMSIKKPDTTGFRSLSDKALKLIKESLDRDEQIFIFSFRKNYASTTVCRDCGQGVTCPTCGHALALLSDTERAFFCPRCNENKSPDIVCTKCGSWNLVPLGVGIDRVKEELFEAGFGDTVVRIDGRQKDVDMDIAAREFADRKKHILLGTEAAFNRLPETVDLTIIASLDSLFAMPLYNAPERTGHLLMRIAEVSKKTVIQTRYTHEDILEGARRGTFQEFAENEFLMRNSLGYPPFRRLINLSFSGLPAAVEKASKKLEELFADHKPDFFEATEPHGRINVRMQIRIEPELWPIVPKTEQDIPDEELFVKLSSLPKAIKIDVE